MEFTLSAFATSLKEGISKSPLFPYENEQIHKIKHKGMEHMRKVAFDNNQITMLDENTYMFELGNEFAEENYPYYHILEQAPVIRKKGRGTSKTQGSQGKIFNKSQRDYEQVNWNGKTFTKEYAKNIRGSRKSVVERAKKGDSDSYANIHYKYIENILNSEMLDRLALEYGMKKIKVESTGLAEEYVSQFNDADLVNSLLNSVFSFGGD